MTQCVILAGGLGTRMLPLTSMIPKSLIDVNGHPFIYYQLKWIAKHNISDVLISVGHYGQMIKDYVGDGSQFSLKVDYVDEGENLLGTGGSLRLAYEQSKLDNNFYLTYGDSFLPIDFNEVYSSYENHNNMSLMTIFKNDNKLDNSNIMILENNFILYDKDYLTYPKINFSYIDYGLSILNLNVLKHYLPSGKSKLSDIFHKLSCDKLIYGHEVHDRFYEVGSFDGLNDFKNWIKNKKF
ncbi:GCD1 Nucleoside-diphosphate-sugar pyrophosphorylase involved in lipopolysaccharide biosynthesis/translation initiation factor 2B, gamma/epsilon subunits (eIF-2Bgamma/eIF-2Bepsilon) [uncultured Caudovirales phage]|uniref:GCD1 Nucleoside-diphosphate-sugar pyrophosphorylase involved in lipopolysaccharide biosynthesis/translation initiation factor 2B, gamma/epsilon subunits (eIF-2Bgamma/eIF-2Bepsilon) n=1 Tax=uncultured Caudovirales phage TaxID=2100421 RepID=A0A6J5RTV2_9CAUD|nr:GCD1 Nucleoside-diphosphate-sugar pyrophosphorylase involved in lipopolysaccharide biosynthesis/translation initiation factor 2B, gamma/epsilon subunits (eIF-2Bgamma/eIF-2Bepsilon) [uncultured Caudovirales phage]